MCKLLGEILPHNRGFDDVVVEHDFPAIGHRKMLLNARRIVDSSSDTQMILLAMETFLSVRIYPDCQEIT